MENLSNIKLNILMEKLYVESAVNRIYEEASEFEWMNDITDVDLTFDGEHEYWIDISELDNDEKNWVMNYLKVKHDADVNDGTLRRFKRYIGEMSGIVLHCGEEDNDYVPRRGNICTMMIPFEDDEDSDNSLYINGKDIIPQVSHHFNLNESNDENEDPSVIKDVLNDLNISKSFLFTFGTGIGALMEPVTKLLEGSGVHLTTVQISLLVVTALIMLLNESNADNAIKKLKEEGIYEYLKGVKDFISNTQKMMNSILKTITNTTYGLADILGFTFILQPAMKVLTELITDYGTSFSSVSQLILGVGAGAATYAVKSVLRKLKKKF